MYICIYVYIHICIYVYTNIYVIIEVPVLFGQQRARMASFPSPNVKLFRMGSINSDYEVFPNGVLFEQGTRICVIRGFDCKFTNYKCRQTKQESLSFNNNVECHPFCDIVVVKESRGRFPGKKRVCEVAVQSP